VADTSNVILTLDNKGPTYMKDSQDGIYNTKTLNDLRLRLLDVNGDLVMESDLGGAGIMESIAAELDAGEYFARIDVGADAVDFVQLYRLDIVATSIMQVPEPAAISLTGLVLAVIAMRRRRGLN